MRQALSIVRPTSAPAKRGRTCFKMTFWLTAPEYIQFIRAATIARLSASRYLVKALGLENAATEETQRMVQAAIARMNTPPAWFNSPAARSRPPRSRLPAPRQAAQRLRKAA